PSVASVGRHPRGEVVRIALIRAFGAIHGPGVPVASGLHPSDEDDPRSARRRGCWAGGLESMQAGAGCWVVATAATDRSSQHSGWAATESAGQGWTRVF